MCLLTGKKDTGVDQWVIIQKNTYSKLSGTRNNSSMLDYCQHQDPTKDAQQQSQLSWKISKYSRILHADTILNPSSIYITKWKGQLHHRRGTILNICIQLGGKKIYHHSKNKWRHDRYSDKGANKHSSKPSQLHFTERVNKLDVQSFVANEKQDKRSHRAEESSTIKKTYSSFQVTWIWEK